MKNMIKALILSLTVLATQNTFAANCDSAYEQWITKIIGQSPDDHKTPGLFWGGLAAGMTGGGVAGAVAGVTLTGGTGVTGGLAVAGSYGVTSSVNKARANKYRLALQVMQEARLGDGLTLREFTSELDARTTIAEVTSVLLDMDKANAQCAQRLYTIEDLGVAVTRSLILTRQNGNQ